MNKAIGSNAPLTNQLLRKSHKSSLSPIKPKSLSQNALQINKSELNQKLQRLNALVAKFTMALNSPTHERLAKDLVEVQPKVSNKPNDTPDSLKMPQPQPSLNRQGQLPSVANTIEKESNTASAPFEHTVVIQQLLQDWRHKDVEKDKLIAQLRKERANAQAQLQDHETAQAKCRALATQTEQVLAAAQIRATSNETWMQTLEKRVHQSEAAMVTFQSTLDAYQAKITKLEAQCADQERGSLAYMEETKIHSKLAKRQGAEQQCMALTQLSQTLESKLEESRQTIHGHVMVLNDQASHLADLTHANANLHQENENCRYAQYRLGQLITRVAQQLTGVAKAVMTAEHRQQQVNQHLDRLVTQQAITLRRIGLAGQTLLQSAQTRQRHSTRLNKRIYATFQQCYHDHGTMDMAPHLYNGTAESSFLQHELCGKGNAINTQTI
ncbi:hypothetical protein H4R35_001202 [Dimargaris xerosporica]|nr:hypothetical protein H4R35_001202 [Dimargaris xerosporica]